MEKQNVASCSTSYDDDDSKTDGKDEMLVDLNLPDEYPIAPKRQKIGEVEGTSDSVFSMQDFNSDLTFEERRLAQFIQLGLEGGRNEEQNNQTSSSESTEALGELFPSVLPPVLGENLLTAMDNSGTNDDLIQGSTIPDSMHVCIAFCNLCYYSLFSLTSTGLSFLEACISFNKKDHLYTEVQEAMGLWGYSSPQLGRVRFH